MSNRRFAGLLVGVILLSIGIYSKPIQNTLFTPYGHIRTWNVFHYYLGAKYFDELGYFDLYTCVLAADEEMDKIWGNNVQVRNLRTYQIASRPSSKDCPRNQFTTKEWEAFKVDLHFLQSTTSFSGSDMPSDRWDYILTDKGPNASPVWVVIARWLTKNVPTSNPFVFKALLSLDIFLLGAALYLVGRAFGLETALMSCLVLVSFWGTERRLVGNLLQYTWLAALLAGIALWKMDQIVASAALFAYAVTTMGFPALILLVWGLCLCWLVGRKRKSPQVQRLLQFFIWFVVLCTGWLGLSLLLPHPLESWRGFLVNIRLHGTHLHGEMLNVGLRNLLTTCCSATHQAGFVYVDMMNEARMAVYYLIILLLTGLFIVGAREKNEVELVGLGYVPIFALLSLSRYYYAGLVIALLPECRRQGTFMWLMMVNLVVFVGRVIFEDSPDVYYLPYWVAQVLYLGFFVWQVIPDNYRRWPVRKEYLKVKTNLKHFILLFNQHKRR